MLVQLDCTSAFNVYRVYHYMGRNVMHCVLCLHHCVVDLHYCGLCSEYNCTGCVGIAKGIPYSINTPL